MNLSPLKIGLIVSLAFHGLVFAVMSVARPNHVSPARPLSTAPCLTLEIVSEPDSFLVPEPEPAARPAMTSPAPPPVLEPAPISLPTVPPVDASVAALPAEPATHSESTVVASSPVQKDRPAPDHPHPGQPAGPAAATFGVSIPSSPCYWLNPKPVYPGQARRNRNEGLVTLRVLVTAEGVPQRVAVKESSGFAVLDNAAMAAVRKWRFLPAKLDEAAVASEVDVPIRFKLAD